MKSTLLILMLLVSCSAFSGSEGERLSYTLGCINCHHQTPKEFINAPPLLIVQSYSKEEFRKLLKTGETRAGRNLLGSSSIMGIVAVEQFSYLTEDEISAIYEFLTDEWTSGRAKTEEAKIPLLYKEELKEGEEETKEE